MSVSISERGHGISWCMYCTGFHPDEYPTQKDMIERMLKPQSTILRQAARFEKKIALYCGKVCCLCGRSYDLNGNLDQTWEMTARFVKLEFDHAGVFGVSDADIKKVVASCREAVAHLFKHIPSLQYTVKVKKNFSAEDAEIFQRLTFAGRLGTIIELAPEGRRMKLVGVETRL